MKRFFLLIIAATKIVIASNQTSDISTVLVNQPLPFNVSIELADFSLPLGIQSGVSAQLGANYVLLAGRTNGLHGFNISDDFPPSQQNITVIVINVQTKTVYTRSLHDSDLTQAQIDTLSVTSPQYYQSGNTLYMTGGYGIDTASATFSTKDVLTAIDVPGLINWVINPQAAQSLASYIRQISNPVFQVTGGFMCQFGQEPTLLIFGQNFIGEYTPSSTGIYTKQVRRFNIVDDGKNLDVVVLPSTGQQDVYRRRDLNVVPIIKTVANNKHKDKQLPAWVALSGVFTVGGGVWTVPVDIASNGATVMANPELATTFKQGMNNYACAHLGLFDKNGDNYTVLFGGLTFEYYASGSFQTDVQIPFTNNVTAIKRSKDGLYQQYLLPCEYPTILSTFANPGNTLLFGTGAVCMIAPNMPVYSNNILNLNKITAQTVVGYIIGGIASTLPNTSSRSDSTASPYIFKVVLTP